MKTVIAASIVVLGALIMASAAWTGGGSVGIFNEHVQGTFQRTYNVTGPVNLEVLTHSGDVKVHAGPAGVVSVSAKITVQESFRSREAMEREAHDIEQNPPITQNGNSIHINYPPEHRGISIDYDITAPAETTLRTETGSGDQTADGLKGNVDLHSGSGDMTLTSLGGTATVRTGSGDVRVHGIAGATTLHTGSGDIRGDGTAALDVETGSGDVQLTESAPGDVRVRTGSGNITINDIQGSFFAHTGSGEITAKGAMKGNWEVQTGSGDVRVGLPSDAAFTIDIHTNNGVINVAQPVATTVQGRVREREHDMSGTVRGGGPTLRVSTGSGDIHVQ
jgi:hypothetical protein